MGNSLPVRHLDQFGRPSAKNIQIFANRGASGIDGNISTALGLAAAIGKEVTAVVGDITFYHDMNGLLATRHALLATIVLINNNGGGIFRRLPISQHEPPFTDLFLTQHGLEFEHAARLYGLDYARVTDRETFREVFNQPHSVSRIIEVVTDGREDYETHQNIINSVMRNT
jgi:2-succinyl-5-enolpyruvyl-6-hydroxy-3-cyclohexene-1-carboxylate synthase